MALENKPISGLDDGGAAIPGDEHVVVRGGLNYRVQTGAARITSINSAYTVLITDQVIDITAGTFDLTLFTAVGNEGRAVIITNAGTGVVTIIPNGAETLGGLPQRTIRAGGVTSIMSDGVNWIIVQHKSGSTDNGYADYNDAATTTTPIAVTGGIEALLTNDALGTFTSIEYLPDGVTRLWDPVNNQLDFSNLKLGDQVLIRGDISVEVLSNNTDVRSSINMALGSVGAFVLPAMQASFKATGTYRLVGAFPLYIGNTDTQLNPAELVINADANVNVTVNGWYIRVN